jgi:preprotein translocase subunit Sec63
MIFAKELDRWGYKHTGCKLPVFWNMESLKAHLEREKAQENLYEVLGLNNTANSDEVKAAYRRAARIWHPDKKPQNEKAAAAEKMKKVNEAMVQK